MKQKYIYENGTPLQAKEQINENINALIIRKNEHKPCLLIIDGMPSTGKTTLGTHIMKLINKKHGINEIDLTTKTLQIGTGTTQFISKLRPCAEKPFPVIMFDEAGEYNKRGWNSKLNKILDNVMDTFRAYNIIIIMVLHDFQELPKHVWNIKLPTMLIHLKERTGNTGHTYWYSLEQMYWIMHYRKTEVFPERAYDRVTPVFRSHFLDLEPKEAEALDKLSTTAKKEKLMGTEIKIQGLLMARDIAVQIHMSEVWVKQTIRRLKIKEETIYKKRKYYPQQISEKIKREIKRQ